MLLRLFAPLRAKVTSSAQSLGLPILKHDELASSLDHLVGARDERWRHVKAERPGGFEIDDQLIFGRRLHRQVGGLLALEDAIDVAGCAAVLVEKFWSI